MGIKGRVVWMPNNMSEVKRTKGGKKKEVTEEGAPSVAAPRKLRSKKMIVKEPEPVEPIQLVPNVILHLKCSLKDLDDHQANIHKMLTHPLSYDPTVPPEIMTLDTLSKTPFGLYTNDMESTVDPQATDNSAYAELCRKCGTHLLGQKSEVKELVKGDLPTEELHAKIKDLKIKFYKNEVDASRRSACFWCTYDFSGDPCYIPRQELPDTLLVYGHFCSPPCAVSYLFKENIDDHTKFERLHFLNKWYGSPHSRGIRPAPHPYYVLDRYLGTLSIQEYRALTNWQGPGLVVIDKPMTRVLPEIHTDNDAAGSTYKIKRASAKD